MPSPPKPLTLAYHALSWADMVPHLATLTRYASEARVIVELGVRGAVSTWALLDGLPPDGRLVSVDSDPHVAERQPHPTALIERYKVLVPDRVADDPRWTLIIGDDRDRKVRNRLPSCDLVFIDTTHEYEHTLAELRMAVGLGARRILLHDYATDDVARAIDTFRNGSSWRLTVEPSEWGLAVLER